MTRHSEKAADDRASTHLQVACLMLASYKVLRPFIRNDQEVLEIIRAQSGDSQDAVWFDKLDRHGVGFARTSWLGSGGKVCSLRLQQLRK
ncbi:hypothetical protein WJX75_007123 [Coccomyxa subellipsoidea]|uniref:Uncharacterized protein n=1 Tax=Coccomyxa subellipsoidea TaxID=248742 RepID=A0ABR2YI53_9CHLO